jgi:adenine deaminase
VALGHSVFEVLQVACLNPVLHYKLPVGQLRIGDPADFIVVNNLTEFAVQQTYLDGVLVAENGQCLVPAAPIAVVNNFHAEPVQANQLAGSPYQLSGGAAGEPVLTPVIECFDGQLITARRDLVLPTAGGQPQPDLGQDVLKLVVLNRYAPSVPPAVAFIKGFGLQAGALASSVGHDSHNLAAVGPNGAELVLPLPVAGLMSDQPGAAVAAAYSTLDDFSKIQLGSTLQAPFMTLSFMALLVIPSLKLSDKGLFDGEKFEFVG